MTTRIEYFVLYGPDDRYARLVITPTDTGLYAAVHINGTPVATWVIDAQDIADQATLTATDAVVLS